MATARYPGDPRARPARSHCAVMATGDTRQRRDELIDRVVVCWLNGNNHDTEPQHLGDTLRNQLGIHHNDIQILKHFPEQFLVIFNNPRDRQCVVDVGVLPDNGRRYQFTVWSECRYANNVSLEFRVKVRIEGIPVHCWAEEVAAKAIGSSCAVHYLEETTRRRQRTRSFDLWAWCSDPCDIPTEVTLMVTEPDRGHPHHDEPANLKHGQVYTLCNHLEVEEDLTFLQDPGRLGGPSNRKARRVFDWDYGVLDTEGERLHGRCGHDRGRDIRPRRDDHDHDERRNHGNHCHRSHSAWARNSHCRGGAEDCISSNRWCGHGESPPRRSRQTGGASQTPSQVWKVREHKKERTAKRVSFALPIATELRAPKIAIPDDSIMFIKVDSNTTQNDTKEKEGGQVVHSATVDSFDPVAVEGMQNNAFTKDFNIATPKLEVDKTGEVLQADVGRHLGMVLGHLEDFLHFARPMEKTTMEAIQDLIEHGAMTQKKEGIQRKAAETPGLAA